MCDESRKTRRRKGDIYTNLLQSIWSEYGNVTILCPMKKVSSNVELIRYLTTNFYLIGLTFVAWNDT